MIRTEQLLKTCAQVSFFVLLAKLAHLSGLWIGQVVGSSYAHFSLASCVPSLVGVYGGIVGSILTALCGGSFHMATGIGIGKLLAYTIPGMCASLCWSTRSLSVRALLPLVCMALFVLHPVGGSAAGYALYWLIPAALALCTRNVVCDALISSFVAHAVGSVIWLYTVPMVASQWLGLIPVVPFERCAIAAGMVLLYGAARQVCVAVQYMRNWRAMELCRR